LWGLETLFADEPAPVAFSFKFSYVNAAAPPNPPSLFPIYGLILNLGDEPLSSVFFKP